MSKALLILQNVAGDWMLIFPGLLRIITFITFSWRLQFGTQAIHRTQRQKQSGSIITPFRASEPRRLFITESCTHIQPLRHTGPQWFTACGMQTLSFRGTFHRHSIRRSPQWRRLCSRSRIFARTVWPEGRCCGKMCGLIAWFPSRNKDSKGVFVLRRD